MTRLEDARKRLGACEQHDDRDHERHGGNELTANEDESVDSGSPVRREGHDPVDGSKAHGENVKNDAGAGEHLEALAKGAVRLIGVLLLRPNVEDEHHEKPDSKINHGANQVAALRQPALLKRG